MNFLFQILKFGLVGFSGLIIDFGITYFLKEKARTSKYLANAIGFLLAAINNFYWNKLWTFEDQSPDYAGQLSSFIAIAAIGLFLNTCFLILFERKLKLSFYFAKAAAIAVVILWNFTMNYLITFS